MPDIGISDYFKDKTIFITGGTGFIGKVLIEKLLRSCPDVRKIYVLIRERRGKSIQERIDEMYKLPLFEKLAQTNPDNYPKKIHPLNGDVSLPNLGLSKEDRALLINEVNIIYHVAATVKFDQALSDAILMNVRGTRDICNLTLQMQHIELMIHVSTAYAHTENQLIEEKMYPAAADWRKCIQAAEKLKPYEMSVLQAKVLGPYPNTYTYTKSLAERVVYDLLDGKVNNMILRPSIIIATLNDPIPGWIDNFNGPVGMLAANGTGLIRINLMKDKIADFLPVDLTVKAFLNATWYRMTQQDDHNIRVKSTSVHNCSAHTLAKMSTYDVAAMAHEFADEIALSTCVWYPTLRRTESPAIYNFVFLFLHVIPALFYDAILRMLSYPPIVLKIQRRIFGAVNALKYFILNDWKIVNSSLYSLEEKIPAKDAPDFAYDALDIDHREYFRQAMYGGMKYLLKEDMSKLDANRKRMKILKVVDIVFTIFFYVYSFYLLTFKWNVLGMMLTGLGNYLDSLHIPLFFSNT